MCPNRFIIAVEAVRGPGASLALLREHLHLQASATLVFSSYSECYFLELDEIDRYQNQSIGMLETVSIMPFKTGEIFRHKISTWTLKDISRVDDDMGIKALTKLGLISPTP